MANADFMRLAPEAGEATRPMTTPITMAGRLLIITWRIRSDEVNPRAFDTPRFLHSFVICARTMRDSTKATISTVRDAINTATAFIPADTTPVVPFAASL